MADVCFDLRDRGDVFTRWLAIYDWITLEDVDLGRRCTEKGLRADFADGVA